MMLAIGAYLRTLRGSVGREKIAVLVGVSQSTIVELEKGREPSLGIALRYCHAVGGDPRDLQDLLLDEQATQVDGQQRALARLRGEVYAGSGSTVPDAGLRLRELAALQAIEESATENLRKLQDFARLLGDPHRSSGSDSSE